MEQIKRQPTPNPTYTQSIYGKHERLIRFIPVPLNLPDFSYRIKLKRFKNNMSATFKYNYSNVTGQRYIKG